MPAAGTSDRVCGVEQDAGRGCALACHWGERDWGFASVEPVTVASVVLGGLARKDDVIKAM